MSTRMYLADGRGIGFPSQTQLRPASDARVVMKTKSAPQKAAASFDADAFDGFVDAHRWVASGTLDSKSVQYQNRMSRVVMKEPKGTERRTRRKGYRSDFDDDDDEDIQREREANLALKAAGFFAFVKSWETKLIAELERNEAGLEEEEKDKNALDVKDKELQLRENMILAKEQKMLKQQLEYLQQQASIQQEAFQMEQQIKYEQNVLTALQEKQRLEHEQAQSLIPGMSNEASKSMLQEMDDSRKEMQDLANRGFVTRDAIPEQNSAHSIAVLRQRELTKNLHTMNATLRQTSKSVQQDAGVRGTVQLLTSLPWIESAGGHRVHFTFIPRNNHVLGKWQDGKLSCLVTDGGKTIQGAWSSKGAQGEFVLTMGADGLSFKGFWLHRAVAMGFWAFRGPTEEPEEDGKRKPPSVTHEALKSVYLVLELAIKHGQGTRSEELIRYIHPSAEPMLLGLIGWRVPAAVRREGFCQRGDSLRFQDVMKSLQGNADLAAALELPSTPLPSTGAAHKSPPVSLQDLVDLHDAQPQPKLPQHIPGVSRGGPPAPAGKANPRGLGGAEGFTFSRLSGLQVRQLPAESQGAGGGVYPSTPGMGHGATEQGERRRREEEGRRETEALASSLEEGARRLRRAELLEGAGLAAQAQALEAEREVARMEELLEGQTGVRVERVGPGGERVVTAKRVQGVARTRGGNSGQGFA